MEKTDKFEQILAGMPDEEFDALLANVHKYRECSVPVDMYLEYTSHFETTAAYTNDIDYMYPIEEYGNSCNQFNLAA